MAYSNDQTQIRAGFVNYIGSLLKSSHYEGAAAQQEVISILIEEALKLSQDKDKVVQLYQIKPMFRGMIFILRQRCVELEKLPKNKLVDEQISKYKNIIQVFEDMIKNIN